LPMAYEHDMSGAYWQIVKMAPSPRVIFNRSRIGVVYHQSMDPERKTKWQRMVEVIAPHKDARLAIVGNWVGRYGAARWRYAIRWHFRRGNLIRKRGYRQSGLSGFGMLIVRLVYELCQEEYLVDEGTYAWVDCVMTTRPTA